MKLYNRLRIVQIVLQLIVNPRRTDLIFKGVKIVSEDGDTKIFEAIENRFAANVDFQKMFAERYNPEPPTIDQLSQFEEGTFGKSLYHHLNSNNLNLDIFPRFECRRPIEYLSLRVYQDHDLWHVLTGYGVTVEDELALQAFGVAQYGSPISALLVAGGLLHLIWKNPLNAVEAFKKIVQGYQRGLQARQLLGIRVHQLLQRPLSEVQDLCRLALSTTTELQPQGLPQVEVALQY